MQIYYTKISTLVGNFLIAGSKSTLYYTSFATGKTQKAPSADWIQDDSAMAYASEQFEAYFAGSNITFNIPYKLRGTSFQLSVWNALTTIPYGQTASYGDIARLINKPGASQAVGAANGANPIPVMIPCHRIIGSDGSLTGFGGGLQTKEKLLRLEGIATAEDQLDLFANLQ